MAVFEEAATSQPSRELSDLYHTFLSDQLRHRLEAVADGEQAGGDTPAGTSAEAAEEAAQLADRMLTAYEAAAGAGVCCAARSSRSTTTAVTSARLCWFPGRLVHLEHHVSHSQPGEDADASWFCRPLQAVDSCWSLLQFKRLRQHAHSC